MAYVPNPADPSQPTGSVDASTAAEEFRALKGYVQGLALGAGLFNGVRQCAQDGAKDANGYPVFLTLPGGGGLALDLDASPSPLTVNFAGGYGATGNNDRIGYLTADVPNVIAGLDALNTDYIYADYVAQANWTWGKTLVPPQYGYAYDRTKQALLHFEGTNGSIVMLDDYGNTWTPAGNAQIDTAVFKVGNSSLKLDGTGDYIESVNFTSLGGGSWGVRCWVNFNALPGAATNMVIWSASNAGGFGAALSLNNTAGTRKLSVALSSDGTTKNIASDTVGADVTWATATWYHVALVFDALQGKYFVYKNGILDQTVVSANKICGVVKMDWGRDVVSGAPVAMNGWIDEGNFLPYCPYPNGVAFVAPLVASAVEGDFFDIQAYKMYSVTAASGVAGTNPTLTQKYRCYLGEADSSAVAATAVRNYAYSGRFASVDTAIPAVGTRTAFQTNLGTVLLSATVYIRNYTAEQNFTPGMIAIPDIGVVGFSESMKIAVESPNIISAVTGSNANLTGVNRTTGASVNLTAANWRQFVTVQRAF